MLVNLKIIYQKETIIILGKKIDLVADINAKDKKGLTPLHYSFINNDERMIKHLLIRGANKFIKDENNLLIYFEFIEYNSVSFIYFYNIIKLMKINEAKKLDKLSQNHLIESKAIEIQNNEIKQYKNNIKSN